MRSQTLRLAAVTALLLLFAVSSGSGFDFSDWRKPLR